MHHKLKISLSIDDHLVIVSRQLTYAGFKYRLYDINFNHQLLGIFSHKLVYDHYNFYSK